MRYEAPESLEGAVALLAGAKGEARVLAGGTDLLVQMRADVVDPELIVDIIRDETAWRRATEKTGAMLSNNPLSAVCKSWPNLGLLVAKPVLRKLYLSRYCIAEDN